MTPNPSLCESCSFMRLVRGRRGQRYFLCENETVEAKYPRQPVLTCHGYAPHRSETGDLTEPTRER